MRDLPRTHRETAKILALLPGLPVASDWAKATAEAGDVTIVSQHHRLGVEVEGGSVSSPPDLAVGGLQLRPKRVFWRANRRLHTGSLLRLLDRLEARGHGVDLIHSHFSASSLGLPVAAARRQIPYVVSEHSSAFTRFNPEKEVGAVGLKIAKDVYENAAAVLPVSRYLESEILQRGLPGRFIVVPNPVDTALFRPKDLVREARVVTVARIAPVKRLELLIRAISSLARLEPNVTLDVVGAGPGLQALRNLAIALSIGDRVNFHGQIDRTDVAARLAQSSVFVMTSYTENMPVAMLEALACGLPVVAPKSAWFDEITSKAPGQSFHPGSVDGLVHALSSYLCPSTAQRGLARQVAVDYYSVEAVGKKLAGIYREVLSS